MCIIIAFITIIEFMIKMSLKKAQIKEHDFLVIK